MRTYCVKQLRQEIENSIALQAFVRAFEAVPVDTNENEMAREASAVNIKTSALVNDINLTENSLLAWQCENIAGKQNIAVLGLSSWAEDTQWIQENAHTFKNDIAFVVDLAKTPTAELSDLIALIKELRSGVSEQLKAPQFSLLLFTNGKTETQISQSGAFKSWLLFAQKENLLCKVLEAKL
jgi:hypothetical protein